MHISEAEGRILSKDTTTVRIRGKGNHSGRAIGKPLFFAHGFKAGTQSADSPLQANEEALYFEARKALLSRLRRLHGELRKECDGAWIFLMQISLLCDEIFTDLPRLYLSEGKSAAQTVVLCRNYFYSVLCKKEGGENLRTVSADIDDISTRLINEIKKEDYPAPVQNAVLLCHTPPSSYMAEWRELLAGVVSEATFSESHHSELALSLGLPYISAKDGFLAEIPDNATSALIDSECGCLYINPDLATLSRFAENEKERLDEEENNILISEKPILKENGKKMLVFAELSGLSELNRLSARSYDGIGKITSEEFYLAEMCLPDEDTLFEEYRRAAESMPTKPVVIRGFRTPGAVRLESIISENPSGESSELYVLYDTTLRTQLRAVMRAAVYGSLQFLLPQSDRYSSLSQCAALMDELSAELYEEDREFSPVPFGSCIDTVASALMCEKIFDECDFAVVDTERLSLAICEKSTALDMLDGDNMCADALIQTVRNIALTASKKKKRAILSLSEKCSADLFEPALLCEFFALSAPPQDLAKIKKSILEHF